VRKTYHPPATPCDRLLQHPQVSEETKALLRDQRVRLDPVGLLHKLRECQAAHLPEAVRAHFERYAG
jgi:hypothetical protein